jgi:hypothetical protein
VERGRKELAPGEDGYSVPSSCPSPSGEGTRGPGVRAGPLKQAPGLTFVPGLSRCGVSDGAASRGAPQGYDLRPRFANRCLNEAIADVQASPRDDPSGPFDSRPRREASPAAAARVARRRERSELVPVGAAFSVPFLAGQKGDTPFGEPAPTADTVAHLPTLPLPLQGGDSRSTDLIDKSQGSQAAPGEMTTQTNRPDIEKAPTPDRDAR